ncbi:hypothetical protein HF324_16850 [Chitinophaga oryzae]|uniref:Uncharacterized protein n=1 Tax=Chitinophaga oryzae TaxID=2725414 RepID=A0AAE7D7M7_9BACT|nr:hypothetical protein [Chitinophaga oryzae]QJB32970.1 hypothetical protein HF329_17260 [Chitinophaga oryzae]QJB39435.1 hypothetical protein HF324_16850 [Chitinophaga oryzae]
MAKGKDPRFEAVRTLIEGGQIKDLRGIYDIIPMTTVGTAVGIHKSTLYKKLMNPGLMKIEECILLGKAFGLTPQVIMTLALNQMHKKSS